MFWEKIRCTIEGLEKSFKRQYAQFDEYGDVEGLYELRDLIVSLHDSDILIEFDESASYYDENNTLHNLSKVSNEFFYV